MSFTSKPVLARPVETPASTAKTLCDFKITGPGSRSFRAEVFVGKVGGTGDLTLQHTAGYGIWEDVKTVALTASTDNTVTFDIDDDIAEDTAHGLAEDTAIVFNTSGSLPAPLEAGKIYYAHPIDADTFQIKEQVGNSQVLDLSTAGSGTHTWTELRVVSITVQDLVTADQGKTPLRPTGRIRAVMDTGETCQVCAVHIVQPTV